jgi:hypothetical protein
MHGPAVPGSISIGSCPPCIPTAAAAGHEGVPALLRQLLEAHNMAGLAALLTQEVVQQVGCTEWADQACLPVNAKRVAA